MTTKTKMKFSEMQLGQIFDVDTGDPEFDYQMYKVSPTEAVSLSRQGIREEIAADREFPIVEGRFIAVHTNVTEVERAAITLIYQHRINLHHPAVRAWVEAIGTDADERRHIDEFFCDNQDMTMEEWQGGVTLRALCEGMGFSLPRCRWAYDWEDGIFSALVNNNRDKRAYPDLYQMELDEAVLVLAYAVHEYRVNGRPDGDQTYTIMGMGAPLMNVQTSLAAAIGEFHQRIVQLMYMRYNKELE